MITDKYLRELGWPARPSWLKALDEKTNFKRNRKLWCAYMRLIIAARHFDEALQAPGTGCQCNAHKPTDA